MTTATLQRAREALDPRKLKLPPRPRVESISVEEMVDWEGDEGLRVQAVIGEDTRDEELTGEFGHTLKFAIRDALEAIGITEFPYLYIAKPSDLVEGAAEDEDDDQSNCQSLDATTVVNDQRQIHVDVAFPPGTILKIEVHAQRIESPNEADVRSLLAALDKATNTTSVGTLARDELYDRDAVRHRGV